MKMTYRPEIDGLRTIAVISVMLYHAKLSIGGINLLPGGYLGVDIFFVISGFLITSLMMSELQHTGTLSILGFYERRVRRLLPALLIVIIVSLPVAWNILLPEQFIDYAKSLLSSVSFGSNFYWHYSLQEYGAESALLKPFLHTWSLAVEEQYYIIYPILLAGIYTFCRKQTPLLLLFGLLISLAFAEWMTRSDPSFSFYMLPSRFWELLTGGLLASVLYLYPDKNSSGVLTRIMPSVGLLLIAHALSFDEYNSDHPGLITLKPVLGTALIIGFSNKSSYVIKMLSNQICIGIGLLSYSLYLWHYPIFSFGRILNAEAGVGDKAIWIALTFSLSFISYKLVEKPFRNRSKIPVRRMALILGSSILFVVLMSVLIIMKNGVDNRFRSLKTLYGKNAFDNGLLAKTSWGVLKDHIKEMGFPKASVNCCKASSVEKDVLWFRTQSKKNILIVGDSHSKDLFNALYLNTHLFKEYELARYAILADSFSEIDALVASPNFRDADIVIVSMRYGNSPDREESIISALPAFLEKLNGEKEHILVSSSTPTFMKSTRRTTLFDRLIKKNLSDKDSLSSFSNKLNATYYEHLDRQVDEKNKLIQKITEQLGLAYLSKDELVCERLEKICFGVTPDGYKTFYDYGHWTLEGAKYFGERIYQSNWLEMNSISEAIDSDE